MCCIAEIIAFIFGIVITVRGTVKLSSSRVVEGPWARVIGVLLMLPVTLGQGGEFLYGAAIGAQRGFERAKQGKQFGAADVQDLQKDIIGPALIINLAGSVIPLLLALGIGLAKAEVRTDRLRRRRRPRPEDDEYDEDDDEEFAVRRRRRDADEDEQDEDDLPQRKRRRRVDDDDDEDDRRIMRKD